MRGVIGSYFGLSLGSSLLFCASCGHQQTKNTAAEHAHAEEAHASFPTRTSGSQGREAKGDFVTAQGVQLDAVADLEEVSGGVRIEVDVDGAEQGRKGVHIHEKGDCSDVSGKSMGEHFALGTEQHGLPGATSHHFGDLGNIDIAANGDGRLIIVVPGANLGPDGERSFAGRAIVIHEAEDVGTGPTGHSGKPIACAVILPKT